MVFRRTVARLDVEKSTLSIHQLASGQFAASLSINGHSWRQVQPTAREAFDALRLVVVSEKPPAKAGRQKDKFKLSRAAMRLYSWE